MWLTEAGGTGEEASALSCRFGSADVPCILTRYGQKAETNCFDGAGWMGLLP
jgi:hypothetical protein